MTNKKHYPALIVLILLLTLTTVAAESFVFKKGGDVNFRFRCFDADGEYCNSVIGCQISTEDPNGRNVQDNRTMTNNPTFFNVSLHTSLFGTYDSIIICQGLNSTSSEFSYLITANGEPLQSFPIQFFFIIISIVFILISYFNERLNLFRYVGSILAMIMGVLTLWPGYSLIDYSTLVGLGMGTILIAIGFYFLVEDAFSRTFQEDRFHQDQGEEEEEDRFHQDQGEEEEEDEFIEEDDNR